MHSTTKLLPAWQNTLREMGLKVTNMLCDMSTRWNSTFDMLEYVLDHCEAVGAVTQDHALGLRKYELDDREWALLEQLHNVLKVSARYQRVCSCVINNTQILKDTTLYFSRSTPNLATVIPAMDLMDEKLTTYSLNRQYSPAIRAAIGLAKRTLNQYYQLTDSSDTYRIAMG